MDSIVVVACAAAPLPHVVFHPCLGVPIPCDKWQVLQRPRRVGALVRRRPKNYSIAGDRPEGFRLRQVRRPASGASPKLIPALSSDGASVHRTQMTKRNRRLTYSSRIRLPLTGAVTTHCDGRFDQLAWSIFAPSANALHLAAQLLSPSSSHFKATVRAGLMSSGCLSQTSIGPLAGSKEAGTNTFNHQMEVRTNVPARSKSDTSPGSGKLIIR